MFELKDVLVAVMLQFLIGVVYAELLKAVFPKVFESKHIQDTDGQTLQAKAQRSADWKESGGTFQ